VWYALCDAVCCTGMRGCRIRTSICWLCTGAIASTICTPDPHSNTQMTDVLRRYPDAAEACVEAVAAIPEEVRAAVPTSAQTPVAHLLKPAELHYLPPCSPHSHLFHEFRPQVSPPNSPLPNPLHGLPTCGCRASLVPASRPV